MKYKISFVVGDDSSPGIIKVQESRPQEGDQIEMNQRRFTVAEVAELTPPRNDEQYMLVTLIEVRTS